MLAHDCRCGFGQCHPSDQWFSVESRNLDTGMTERLTVMMELGELHFLFLLKYKMCRFTKIIKNNKYILNNRYTKHADVGNRKHGLLLQIQK